MPRILLAVGQPNDNELWVAKASSPLSSVTFTISATSSAFIAACAQAFSGAHFASPFDANAAIPNAVNTTGDAACTTSNTTDILIGAARVSGGTTIPGAGWTLIGGSGNFFGFEYQSVTSTQSATAATWAGISAAGSICDAIIKGP